MLMVSLSLLPGRRHSVSTPQATKRRQLMLREGKLILSGAGHNHYCSCLAMLKKFRFSLKVKRTEQFPLSFWRNQSGGSIVERCKGYRRETERHPESTLDHLRDSEGLK